MKIACRPSCFRSHAIQKLMTVWWSQFADWYPHATINNEARAALYSPFSLSILLQVSTFWITLFVSLSTLGSFLFTLRPPFTSNIIFDSFTAKSRYERFMLHLLLSMTQCFFCVLSSCRWYSWQGVARAIAWMAIILPYHSIRLLVCHTICNVFSYSMITEQ